MSLSEMVNNTAVDVSESAEDLLKTLASDIATDLSVLATLHDREISSQQLEYLTDFSFSDWFGAQLTSETELALLKRTDELLKEWRNADKDKLLDDLAVDYAAIYLNHTYHASPLESVWLDEENLICQDAMFSVREVYKNYDIESEDWRLRSDDHLVCQMQFFTLLLRSETVSEKTLAELATFYDEHLFRWLRAFSQRVSERCSNEFYALLCTLTYFYFESIRDVFADLLNQSRPTLEEVEKRIEKRKKKSNEVELKYMPGHSPSW